MPALRRSARIQALQSQTTTTQDPLPVVPEPKPKPKPRKKPAEKQKEPPKPAPVHQEPVEQVPKAAEPGIEEETFDTKPPSGYSFLSAGNVALTRRAKKLALESGRNVYHVMEWTHAYRSSGRNFPPSRIGYHIPTRILQIARDQVDAEAGKREHQRERREQREKDGVRQPDFPEFHSFIDVGHENV